MIPSRSAYPALPFPDTQTVDKMQALPHTLIFEQSNIGNLIWPEHGRFAGCSQVVYFEEVVRVLGITLGALISSRGSTPHGSDHCSFYLSTCNEFQPPPKPNHIEGELRS